LLKRVQLTISGCVGPCDVPNVVVITISSGTEWLGNVIKFDQHRSLLEWAVRCDASRIPCMQDPSFRWWRLRWPKMRHQDHGPLTVHELFPHLT